MNDKFKNNGVRKEKQETQTDWRINRWGAEKGKKQQTLRLWNHQKYRRGELLSGQNSRAHKIQEEVCLEGR